jgi:hypothetical protein
MGGLLATPDLGEMEVGRLDRSRRHRVEDIFKLLKILRQDSCTRSPTGVLAELPFTVRLPPLSSSLLSFSVLLYHCVLWVFNGQVRLVTLLPPFKFHPLQFLPSKIHPTLHTPFKPISLRWLWRKIYNACKLCNRPWYPDNRAFSEVSHEYGILNAIVYPALPTDTSLGDRCRP